MGKFLIFWLIFVIILLIAIVLVVLYVRNSVRKFSRSFLGTDDIAAGIRRTKEEVSQRPLSVNGMTKLMLPQIQKDFPEFGWNEFKTLAENTLTETLTAISTQNLSYLQHASDRLRFKIKTRVDADMNAGVTEHYNDIKIHQTEISSYRKTEGECIITLQSSLEYTFYRTGGGYQTPNMENLLKTQTKYNSVLIYIQDLSKISTGASGIGLNCPNCGAPITKLGSKFCEFCGTAIKEVSIRVWSLEDIEEALS